MKKMEWLRGVGVALITPFNEDNSIDYNAFVRLLKHIENGGASYVVIAGTTAETPTLTKEEKQILLEKAKKTVSIPIVYGCGGYNTLEIIKELKETNLNGVSAILSVTPYYNKPTQNGLIHHYSMIAENCPLPIILYNVPGRTGCNLLPSTVFKLAEKYENIIGVKEASGDINQIMEIIRGKPENFYVISGDDNITLPLLSIGVCGVISVIANAFPAEWSELVSLALNDKYQEARKIHYRFLELCRLLFVEGNPAGIKAVLSILGLCKNILRPPLVPVSQQTYQKIKECLHTIPASAT